MLPPQPSSLNPCIYLKNLTPHLKSCHMMRSGLSINQPGSKKSNSHSFTTLSSPEHNQNIPSIATVLCNQLVLSSIVLVPKPPMLFFLVLYIYGLERYDITLACFYSGSHVCTQYRIFISGIRICIHNIVLEMKRQRSRIHHLLAITMLIIRISSHTTCIT